MNVALSCLLYVSDDFVTVFHKSVIDWLLAKGYQGHQYAVKISSGDKVLWQICEKVFEEIKEVVCSGHELDFNNDVKYALEYGFVHLFACDMKKCWYWLVDVVIVHAMLSKSARDSQKIYDVPVVELWKNSLRFGGFISNELRALISWHIVEIESMARNTPETGLPSSYVESVVARSPKGCFSDDEKKIAKSLLSKTTMLVDLVYDEVEVIPHALWCPTGEQWIEGVGISNDKTMVALAIGGEKISVLSLPSLIELFQYSANRIACCAFAPDDSFVLFGNLETALSIVEKQEIPFFHGNQEMFESCAFSPNGKRLVTSDGSSTIKLWDVGEQSLLSLLCHEVPCNWCSFDSTGLFIVGNGEYEEDLHSESVQDLHSGDHSQNEKSSADDLICVWNALTLQRCDMRTLPEGKFKSGKAFQSKLCKRCFRPGLKKTSSQILAGGNWSRKLSCEFILMMMTLTLFSVLLYDKYSGQHGGKKV